MRARKRSCGRRFRSLISVADSDADKAAILQNFALQERAVDDV